MRARIDAIYKRGKLRLLKPVSLAKGTRVEVVILANEDDVREQNDLDMLSEVAVGIEHALKGPLGIMEMDISRIKDKHRADPELTRQLEDLEKQRRKILEMARVVSFLGASENFVHGRLERTQVRELIHNAIRSIKKRLNNEGIELQVSGDSLFAMAESHLLRQAIDCLIQNFVDAINETGRKSGVIHIKLDSSPQPEEMSVIQITDRNRTLPQKDNLELKDLFSIGDRRGSRDTLGLFLVQRIIRLHEGFTNLQRVGEEGATLSIFLPAG